MTLQCALRAGKINFWRPEDGLSNTNKQRDTKNHHHDRDKPAPNTWQGDVAEACRCYGSNRKVQSLDITVQPFLVAEEERVNKARHYKKEGDQVDHSPARVPPSTEPSFLKRTPDHL